VGLQTGFQLSGLGFTQLCNGAITPVKSLGMLRRSPHQIRRFDLKKGEIFRV
jgi:hypothetical protein